MRIDRLHPANIGDHDLDVALVIDVFRATSTAAALASRVSPILVVGHPDALGRLPPKPEGYLVFSELSIEDNPHEQVDNSPALAARIDLGARTPVLVTTNGTKAISAALSVTTRVYLASFTNLRAAASVATAWARDRVTVLPAGHFDTAAERVEDEACAAALTQLMRGESFDDETAATSCFDSERVQRRIRKNPEFLEDARHAVTVDRYSQVLQAVPKPDQREVIELRPVTDTGGDAGSSVAQQRSTRA